MTKHTSMNGIIEENRLHMFSWRREHHNQQTFCCPANFPVALRTLPVQCAAYEGEQPVCDHIVCTHITSGRHVTQKLECATWGAPGAARSTCYARGGCGVWRGKVVCMDRMDWLCKCVLQHVAHDVEDIGCLLQQPIALRFIYKGPKQFMPWKRYLRAPKEEKNVQVSGKIITNQCVTWNK